MEYEKVKNHIIMSFFKFFYKYNIDFEFKENYIKILKGKHSISLNNGNTYNSVDTIKFNGDKLEVTYYRYFDDSKTINMEFNMINFIKVNHIYSFNIHIVKRNEDTLKDVVNLLDEALTQLNCMEID